MEVDITSIEARAISIEAVATSTEKLPTYSFFSSMEASKIFQSVFDTQDTPTSEQAL